MNISKISMAQPSAFKAKTTITAPTSLLSEEDKVHFEQLGSKIGKDTDSIEITISDIHPSVVHPDVKVYDYSGKTSINGVCSDTHITIPYREETSPKNYLTKVFSRLQK